MIRAIALDDEPPALEVIQALCDSVDFIDLQKTFTSSDEANRYIRKHPVDLLFIDVQMPQISGLDFIRALPRKIQVVLTTAYPEFAVDGFDLEVTDYLLKPIGPTRFLQAAEKVKALMDPSANQPGQQFLYVRADYSLIKIPIIDIILIEGLDDYLKIYIHNHRTIVTRMTMKNLLEKLTADFIRVHRSFIVPLSRVKRMRNKTLYLEGREIPVSASYEKELKAKMEERGE